MEEEWKKERRKERRVKKGKKSGRRKERRVEEGKKSGRRKEEWKKGKKSEQEWLWIKTVKRERRGKILKEGEKMD